LRRLPFLGLLVGIAGLIVHWVADPSKFTGNVVMACGLIFTFVTGVRSMITARRAT
jgi:hypothetical protein